MLFGLQPLARSCFLAGCIGLIVFACEFSKGSFPTLVTTAKIKLIAMTRPFGLTITQPAKAKHSGTVILLHGLGDTAHGWAPVGPQLNLPHLKFVYPTAPTGQSPSTWECACQDVLKGKPMDPDGVAESVQHVKELIDKETNDGISPNRIVVGGFSQGGHIALKAVLTHTPPLAACVAMSTWLEPSKMEIPPQNLKIPIFQAHGDVDPVVPTIVGSQSHEVLQGLGCTAAELHMYSGMGHSSCAQELSDLRAFLLKVLPEAQPTREEVQGMSARELKQFIQGKGASTTGLLEKPELLEKAMSLL